ncbi:MAG: ABC transporter substrate-binding protein [Oscillospiraceae bacterium]|jgi:putative aldouronate transport system substrate-binding protein|nr:ABC transporter substrate-binding protein [Oscillospiraceae bacterium]
MKNMKMKKGLLALLALTLALGAFAAPSMAEEPINLTWWVNCPGDVPVDAQMVEDAANAVSKDTVGITATIMYKLADQMALSLSAGEYYDMMFTCEWVSPNFIQNAYDGYYADLTDLLPSLTPDLYATLDPVVWDAARVNGRIYAVPTKKDLASEMFWRLDSDFYEGELGWTIPEEVSFDELETYLEAFKENRPNEYAIFMSRNGLTNFTNFAQRVVGYYLVVPYEYAGTDKGTTIIPFYEYDELMHRYELLHKWYTLGYINPDAAVTESVTYANYSSVRSGQAWTGYTGWGKSSGHSVKIARYDGPFMSTATMQGAMQAINAGASQKNIEASLKYMEYLSTDRSFRDILMYGVEGTHFNYLDNGTVLRTDQGRKNFLLDGFTHGSVAIASVESSEDTLADPLMWEKVYAGYDRASVSDLGGFAFNGEDYQIELSAMNAVWDKYKYELQTGTSDPAVVIPQLKAELESAGLLDVQKAAQAQLDAYLESQR